MKGHSLWQILGRDLPIRVKFLVINFLVMATTLIVSAILILRASTAVRENTLSAEKALITHIHDIGDHHIFSVSQSAHLQRKCG